MEPTLAQYSITENRSHIRYNLIEIISNMLYAYPSEITEKSDLSKLGIDSLDTVEIMMAIENKYDIHILDSDVELICKNGTTINSLVDYLMPMCRERKLKLEQIKKSNL
jgi:acyl carrier protein